MAVYGSITAATLCTLALPGLTLAANHREAPITALDHKADITDVFAFVSYGPNQAANTSPSKVTLIMCVDPFIEPANGPNWSPFDPDILYQLKVDNDNDAKEDITFEVRFKTEQRLPNLFQVYAGVPGGAVAPANSPAPVAPGTAIVPPRITSFADAGLGQRQTYTVSMVRKGKATKIKKADETPFYAVPANVGPRTMDYAALFAAGTYILPNGISVFAGTTDDPFWIDLGGAFDTFNLRAGVAPGALSAAQDAAVQNFATDTVAGYAVNTIAIEVPVTMLTKSGLVEPASSTGAAIGVWCTTSRPKNLVRRSPDVSRAYGDFRQVQRMGNPLINELLIGTGSKDRFSMDRPRDDKRFTDFFLDPALPRVINALTGGVVAIPAPPRTDLLPVVQYAPPIAAAGTPAGPIADLLRLNVGVPATPPATASRLGVLGGDSAGFPNGRRLGDDVTDIALRLVVGGVLAPPFAGFNAAIGGRLGDGVNVNDVPYRTTFPYVADCPSGRNHRHLDPNEAGGGPE